MGIILEKREIKNMDESTKYLRAMLFIQLQSLPGTMTFSKAELLLHRAGFGHKEISELLEKKKRLWSRPYSGQSLLKKMMSSNSTNQKMLKFGLAIKSVEAFHIHSN